MQIDHHLPLTTYFTDPLIFSYVLPFLNIPEQLNLALLNKQVRYYILQNSGMP